jgi:hypothetical protein
MKIKHPDPATGVAYMMGVSRAEWVAIKVAVEICMEDLQNVIAKGHVMTANQIAILALFTEIHTTMEGNTRACPDLPIQDEAVRAPGGRDQTRFPTIQEWARRGFPVRPKNWKDQNDNR